MSKLARSFILINLSEIVFVLSGYFIHAYLGRLLSPADYGRYGLIVTLATMSIVFVGDGIPKALSKFISQFPEKEKIIKRKSAIAQVILIGFVSLIYYFAAPFIADFFRDKSLLSLIKLSTLIIPAFAAASFYNHYFNGLHMFGMQALQRSIRSAARIMAILIMAFFWGIQGAIIGYIVAPVLVSVFSYFADSHRKKPIEGDFPYSDIIRFGLGVTGFMVAYNLVINIDLFLTKRLLESDYWVGIYNAVITVGRIPFYFFSNLAFLLLPTISNLMQKRTKEEARKLIQKSMRYIIMLILPTVAVIMIFSKEMITLLYSKKYIEGELALKIFVAGVGCLTIFYICVFILNGSGKVRKSLILTWLGLLINFSLNYLMIPRWGILGSAIATAATSFCLMMGSLYMVGKTFGKFIDIFSLLRTLGVTLGMLIVFWFIPRSTMFFIPEAGLFFVLYFVILTLIKEMNEKDRERLKRIFQKSYKAKARE
ncbi:MAG: flippase [Patescibacteria group bacterium]|nr:flippase [Patescibacteria group bacterium]